MTDNRLLTDHLYDHSYEEPLATTIYVCDNCGDSIFEEEYYYEIDNEIICEECIREYRKTAIIHSER